MLERTGNLWTMRCDARCVTTNGWRRWDGSAVMGRGVALQARQRYPDLEYRLGRHLGRYGNHVGVLLEEAGKPALLSFPVKVHWANKGKLELILQSAQELMTLIRAKHDWERVLLPRPGCGNGRLLWDDVRLVIAPVLDDRVIVIDRDGSGEAAGGA